MLLTPFHNFSNNLRKEEDLLPPGNNIWLIVWWGPRVLPCLVKQGNALSKSNNGTDVLKQTKSGQTSRYFFRNVFIKFQESTMIATQSGFQETINNAFGTRINSIVTQSNQDTGSKIKNVLAPTLSD